MSDIKFESTKDKTHIRYRKILPKFLEGNGDALIIFNHILDKYRFLIKKNPESLIRNHQWFVCKASTMEEVLGISKFRRNSAIKFLEKKNMIHTHNKTNYGRLAVKINMKIFKEIDKYEVETKIQRRMKKLEKT